MDTALAARIDKRFYVGQTPPGFGAVHRERGPTTWGGFVRLGVKYFDQRLDQRREIKIKTRLGNPD